MELSEAIAARRSIRKFKPANISRETIRLLIDAARLAPSGSNLQPARFIVAQSPETKEGLGRCTPYKFIVRAPAIFVCLADLSVMTVRDARMTELLQAGAFDGIEVDKSDPAALANSEMDTRAIEAYLSLNVAIAVEHIILKAVDLGLGSCWIGRFSRKKVRQLLALEENMLPVALLPAGYPDQSPKARPRLPLDKYLLKTL